MVLRSVPNVTGVVISTLFVAKRKGFIRGAACKLCIRRQNDYHYNVLSTLQKRSQSITFFNDLWPGVSRTCIVGCADTKIVILHQFGVDIQTPQGTSELALLFKGFCTRSQVCGNVCISTPHEFDEKALKAKVWWSAPGAFVFPFQMKANVQFWEPLALLFVGETPGGQNP